MLPDFNLTTTQKAARQVLNSEATHICLAGGSRSGKTFLIVRQMLIRAGKAPGSRHAIFRFTFSSIKSAIVYDTLPKVLMMCFPHLPPLDTMLNKTDWFMKLPNGSEIWFGGLDTPERAEKLLGNEYATVAFNETSQIPWGSYMLALTRLAQNTQGALKLKSYVDLNPDSKRGWVYQRFVAKRDPISKAPSPRPFDFGFYLMNPEGNKENLPAEYMEILNAMPTKERNRYLLGQFSEDSDGALWTEELLHQQRVLGQEGTLPDWLRIVIAVDPSGASGPEDFRSDEIGIVVIALGTDGKAYLLEDLSGRYGPGGENGWGAVVANAYERHNADRVVGEKNFGGDMVRFVIHAENPDIPYTAVTASRGKVVRAEPVSFLYEQEKIFHVGHFPELEDQLCSMNQSGYVGIKSPDRMDALVWAITELFPKITKRKVDENIRPPQVRKQSRSASRFDRPQQRR